MCTGVPLFLSGERAYTKAVDDHLDDHQAHFLSVFVVVLCAGIEESSVECSTPLSIILVFLVMK